jgi:hypothetical protein
MRIRNVVAPLLLAAASAVAITVAPLAEPAPAGPTCTATGANSTLCQSNGNAQVNATPPPVNYQPQYPFFGRSYFTTAATTAETDSAVKLFGLERDGDLQRRPATGRTGDVQPTDKGLDTVLETN